MTKRTQLSKAYTTSEIACIQITVHNRYLEVDSSLWEYCGVQGSIYKESGISLERGEKLKNGKCLKHENFASKFKAYLGLEKRNTELEMQSYNS